ncbi:MAG: hypothetical protein D6795_08370 [Deltaproteobacteria bacterium]|nr:MAG: hypothetical protein D6795_08370 [Deltaproteobacteria bacterium]
MNENFHPNRMPPSARRDDAEGSATPIRKRRSRIARIRRKDKAANPSLSCYNGAPITRCAPGSLAPRFQRSPRPRGAAPRKPMTQEVER